MFKKSIFLIITVLFLSSCAYYNTFYNAQKFFNSAQKKPLNPKGKANASAIEEYNKVIKKCGIILTDYKDSKWADDALFLLAKALYYRGNNELQSKEKFEDLIKFYPDSPFFAESHLYIARIEYDLNNKDIAISLIQEFIKNSQFKKDHPQALILITDMLIKEKNYIDAQFYLRILIEKYPDSKEFDNAYFLLGKSYFDINDYDNSLKVFQNLIKTRIEKSIKLDASYYIVYNFLMKKNITKAQSTIKSLLKQEFRDEAIQKVLLLNARIKAESGALDEAISIMTNIMENNQRSLLSAETAYYLGELYFTKLNDYEKAIQTFNKVKSENNQSPYVESAITRSSIASQIIQLKKQNRNIPLDDLLAEQFKLAEYYLYELDLPDSALIIYKKIPSQLDNVVLNAAENLNKINELDSLIVRINEKTFNDSLLMIYNASFQDSISFSSDMTDSTRLANLKIKKDNAEKRSVQLTKDTELYQHYYIPYSIFVRMIIYDYIIKDSTLTENLHQKLINEYPDNRFTIAADDYFNHKTVSFLTIKEKRLTNEYDEAISLPADSLNLKITLLSDIANSDYEKLAEQAKFSLGYVYYFEMNDSLNAKKYFDEVLSINPQSDYSVFIKQFYTNSSFKIINVLPSIVELEEKMRKQFIADSIKANSLADSLLNDSTATDSTNTSEKNEKKETSLYNNYQKYATNTIPYFQLNFFAILNKKYFFDLPLSISLI